jgi:protein involved in polysaccharide export with SLBB domain
MSFFSTPFQNSNRTFRLGFLLIAAVWAATGPLARVSAQRIDLSGPRVDGQTETSVVFDEDEIDPNQPLKTNFVINVSVLNEAQPSGNYRVNPSGNVLLHLAEVLTPVSVTGLTSKEATKKITEFLKAYIKDPTVTVTIVSVPPPVATITGAIRKSGPTTINRRTTLMELLSKAEWADIADLSQVRVTRRSLVNGQEKAATLVYNIDHYVQPEKGKSPDETQNPVLEDKDSVFVPLKARTGGLFSVSGEVTKPAAGIILRSAPPLTVREAIAFVGGMTPIANHKRVSILRVGQSQPLIVDLDKAEQGDKINNTEIRPDDAIYVERLGDNAFVEMGGAFYKPGRLVFDKKMTLTQAIMQAGGLSPLAKSQEGMILRHVGNDPNNTVFIPFKWKALLAHKTEDIALQPGDGVWVDSKVPNTSPGGFGALSALLPFGSLLGHF